VIVAVVDKTGRAVRNQHVVLGALGLGELARALERVASHDIAEAICAAKPFCSWLGPSGEDWVGRVEKGGVELRLVRHRNGKWTALLTLPFEYTEGVEYVLGAVHDLALEVEGLRREARWLRERLVELERRLAGLESAREGEE